MTLTKYPLTMQLQTHSWKMSDSQTGLDTAISKGITVVILLQIYYTTQPILNAHLKTSGPAAMPLQFPNVGQESCERYC